MAKLRLQIDKHRLDDEWVEQAVMRKDYGDLYADAVYEVDQAKAELAVVAARIDREVRDSPEQFGYPKVTESIVERAIVADKRHIDAMERYNKARHVMNTLDAAVQGLEHRKRALTCLGDLQYGAYYGGKRSSEDDEPMPQGVRDPVRGRYTDGD